MIFLNPLIFSSTINPVNMTADIIAIASNGVYEELPPPSSYKVIDMEINALAERSMDHYTMNKERGAIKKQISLSWNLLEPSDFKRICELTGTNSCSVECYDPQSAGLYKGDFYRDTSFDYTIMGGPWYGGPKYVRVNTLVLTEM